MSMATPELQRHLGKLFEQALYVSSPLAQLHLIREKIGTRGYQVFDKGDIRDEMGRLQQVLRSLEREMLLIDDLLNQQGQ